MYSSDEDKGIGNNLSQNFLYINNYVYDWNLLRNSRQNNYEVEDIKNENFDYIMYNDDHGIIEDLKNNNDNVEEGKDIIEDLKNNNTEDDYYECKNVSD